LEEGAVAPPDSLSGAFSAFLDLPYGDARNRVTSDFERAYLERLMQKNGGNVAQAAREADMARSHLNELLRRHKIR
jgi:DNA-binding NtrC family response regulator